MATISGMTINEMKMLEMEYLSLIDYKLSIGAEQFIQYVLKMKTFFMSRKKVIMNN